MPSIRKKLFFTFFGLLQVIPAFGKETAITIYSSNLALVRETREIELANGISHVSITDIPGQIIPASVYFNSLTAPNQVIILEQNYEYDLVNSAKLLQRYVDHAITFETKSGKPYSGTLLSSDHQNMVIRENAGLKSFRIEDLNEISFPQLPEGLITRPTLHWTLQTDKSGKHNSELGYLTRGVSWNSEYIAVVNDSESQLDLSAWVSIDNTSGIAFEDARIKLVAGDIHEVRPLPGYLSKGRQAYPALEAAMVEEKQFFEYHLYTLTRKSSIKNNENKQVALFEPATVSVAKSYRYDAHRSDRNAAVFLEFKNDKKSGLGMPLPAGVMRAYKRDASDKSLVFLGEDRIEHTPKDELIETYIGNAFDIIGERNQLNVRHLGSSGREEEWEVKLRNHKDIGIEVIAVEHLNPGWEITLQSHAHTKKDAVTTEFKVQVPKDGEAVIKYTVRYLR
jgi:hypothetical protein